MSRLRWRKVLRDLWLHKPRAVLVVLAMTVGLATAGAVLDKWALLRQVTRDGYLATNPATATLRTERVDSDLLVRVAAVPGVAAAQGRREVAAAARGAGAWQTASLLTADDLGKLHIHTVRAVEGQWPPPPGTVAVESSSVELAEVALGDVLTVQVGDQPPRDLPVAAIVRDSGLAPGWMEHVVYAFATPETLEQLGAGAHLDELQVLASDRGLDRGGARRLAVAVQEVVVATGRTVYGVEVPVPGRHLHAGQMDSLLLTQGAFGLLALLLSAFLVTNLVGAMLHGQLREIGIMKAVGGSAGQIAAMYLGLALTLGAVACAVAVPLGAVLGWRYALFSAEMLNFDLDGHGIPGWAVALQLAVGLLLPVFAAALPVARGCRIPVGAALRDCGIDPLAAGSPPGLLLRYAGGRLSRPLLLGLRNAFRRRGRMALTAVTLAFGGAVFLAALDLRVSIRGSVDHLFGTLLRFDGVVRLDGPQSQVEVERLAAAVPGVAGAEAWGAARAVLRGADGLLATPFSITFVPPGSAMLDLPVDAGRWLREGDERALVVNRSVHHDVPDLAVGREVTLLIGGRPSRWRVVGVVGSGPGSSAWAPRQALGTLGRAGTADAVVVTAADDAPGAGPEALRRVRDELAAAGMGVASSQVLEGSRRVIEDHLLMIAAFLVVMAQLAVLVGALGLASTMSLAVLERTRELGVMRAIGARHGTLHAMVQLEGLVVALLGWALAVPLSVPFSVILGERFGRIMIPVEPRFVPEPAGVLWWLLVSLVVAVLSCAWPAFRATRVPTARALAYE
jgi:putative ABC transport system permease protein